MNCLLIPVEQGSEAWDALRRTRLTASRLADVMAKETSQRHLKYKQELILECMGHTHAEEEAEWFRHGREMEPNAIRLYELKYGGNVIHDCFLVHSEYHWLSCSPDLLEVDDMKQWQKFSADPTGKVAAPEVKEGGEVKCRKTFRKYREAIDRAKKYHAADKPLQIPQPEYRFQIQGAMWLTGLDHWWYVNYYESRQGDVRIGRAPVPRDQNLIDQMEERCVKFMTEVYEEAGLL